MAKKTAIISICFTLQSGAIAPTIAQADPLVAITNTPNGTNGGSTINNTSWKSLLFSTPTAVSEISSIQLGLNCQPVCSYPSAPQLQINLYSVASGHPDTLLNNLSLVSVPMSQAQQMYNFSIPNWLLAPDSAYALVLQSDATGIKWGNTGTPGVSPTGQNGYTFLGFSLSTDAGLSWSSSGIASVNAVTISVQQPTLLTGNSYLASNLGISVNPVFQGGTLQMDLANQLYNQHFTLDSSTTNTIDQFGNNSTFTGNFTDASGPGNLVITNSGSGGAVIFSGTANSYSGTTTIFSGATLKAGVANAFSAASVMSLNTGSILDLGGFSQTINQLNLNGGTVQNGTLSAAISSSNGTVTGIDGTASLTANSGITYLEGNNAYSGGTQVHPGANLVITSGAALGSGDLALIGSLTQAATLSTTATTTISNQISVTGDPIFNIASGTTATISSPISGTGDLVVTGGGVLDLTAINTYSGPTTIETNSSLALSGIGSIANSAAINNFGTLNLANAASTVNFNGNFNQSATGNLLMANLSPTSSQLLNISGSAALNGGLTVNASAGSYTPHRYTLLTANNGLSTSFGSFSTNLSAFTRLGYALSYDANHVYLDLSLNPTDTQAALQANLAALQGVYAIQTGTINNSLNYDCAYFNRKGLCLSTGGRYSNASNSHTNTTSAMLIGAYQLNKQLRLGAYIDQNLYNTEAGSIASLQSNTPLLGMFGVWNEHTDQTGWEARLAAAYNNSNLAINRTQIGSSELGFGKTGIDTLSGSATLSYGINLLPNWMTSPYFGIRNTTVSSSAYSEQANVNVTAPLSYNGINQESLTALLGFKTSGRLTDQIDLQAIAGLEQDLHTYSSTYSASGVDGLTSINFTPNSQKSRAISSFGANYALAKGHRLGLNAIWRQESFQSIDTKMAYFTYTMAF